MNRILKSLAVLGMVGASVSAQTMEETIKKLGEAAGKAYAAPIVSAFGSNLNAGWYHKAPAPKKFGFHFEAGVVGMATLLGGGSSSFTTSGAFRLDSTNARTISNQVDTTGMFGQGQTLRDSVFSALRRTDINVVFAGPTIIGPEDAPMTYDVSAQPLQVRTAAGDTTIQIAPLSDTIPGEFGLLEDLPALPLFAPQVTLGTVYGTNLTVRWLPEIEPNEELGAVKFFGFGVQHNPGVWLGSTLPVDLSVGFFTQSLKVGDLFEASSQAIGLNVSKTLGWRFLNVTPYGGVQYEKSSFDFAYEFETDGEVVPIEFSMEGDNKYRATAGLSIRLLALNINADYNFAKYPSASFGVMVGI